MHNVQCHIAERPQSNISRDPNAHTSTYRFGNVCRARILEEHTASSRWLSRPA